MKRKVKLRDQEIEYQLRKSKRARRMRLAVYCDTSVVVTLPYGASENIVEKFIREKSRWLFGKIEYFKKYKATPIKINSRGDYKKRKGEALAWAISRAEHFNEIYKFKYNKIFVKNQKTRWGSCSRKGNLNYNYKILYLPARLADYIIVHELCHLREFNHTRKFWDLVARAAPDYLDIKKELKNNLV